MLVKHETCPEGLEQPGDEKNQVGWVAPMDDIEAMSKPNADA